MRHPHAPGRHPVIGARKQHQHHRTIGTIERCTCRAKGPQSRGCARSLPSPIDEPFDRQHQGPPGAGCVAHLAASVERFRPACMNRARASQARARRSGWQCGYAPPRGKRRLHSPCPADSSRSPCEQLRQGPHPWVPSSVACSASWICCKSTVPAVELLWCAADPWHRVDLLAGFTSIDDDFRSALAVGQDAALGDRRPVGRPFDCS